MNLNMCNHCGGKFEYKNGRWVCASCGSYKPEEISNEEVTLLYNAFQKLRLADFDEAEQEFDDIVQRYPENSNVYWGRLMSRYGIKYEVDFDGKMIPTCYATSIESVVSDPDYRKALQYADEESRVYYEKQAEYMERVRKEWVEKASKEKPYDIFICYKDSDLANNIKRTQDSIAAQDLYIHLTNKGYRVFYSHGSLRDKVGEKYESHIFNALSTAKVMLVYGSNPDYITSTWLKNEWTRYAKQIQLGEKKPNSLLVACDGFSPNELPRVLSAMQCFNANERSFYGDLDEVIDRIIGGEEGESAYGVTVGKKKNSRAPVWISLFLILAALGGFLAWNFLGGGSVMTVTNSTQNATAVSNGGWFPKGTEFHVEEIHSDEKLETMAGTLSIKQNTYHLYDMELRNDGKVLDVSGNVTVTIPLPAGMDGDKAVVYYMSGNVPKKIPSQVSDGNITFVTNHFSVYMIAEEILGCTHEAVTDEAVKATCTEDGLTEGKHCSLCGEILVAQTVVPAAHVPGPEADCTNGQNCTVCREEIVASKGHTPGAEATCTTAQQCTVCHIELAPAKGHNIGPAATCTTAQKCTACNVEFASAKGHTPGAEATCTTAQRCTACNTVLNKALGHTPGAEATCTAAQTCTVCQTMLVSAKGHTEVTDAAVEPDCTNTGLTAGKHCSVCNEVLKAQETFPAKGHTPGAAATCTAAQTCTVCQTMLVSAKGHMEVTDAAVEPDCTNTGLTVGKHCSVCNEVLKAQETLPAKGHTPGTAATCTAAQTCTVCYATITEATGHTVGKLENVKAPTKTENGLKVQKCSSCGERLNEEIIPATGSIGLQYQYNGDGTYTVSGIGTCADADIVIPAIYNEQKVTAIGEKAFRECSDITSVTILSGVTSIGEFAFTYCTSLTSIKIPNSVTSIGDDAFSCCISLTRVDIPNSVTSIGSNAFYGCTGLTSIEIPTGVTSIDGGTFCGCTGLTSVEIPTNVTSIGYFAFDCCLNLTSIVYGGTTAQWEAITFDSHWNSSTGNYTVYCTDGKVSKDGKVTLYSSGLAFDENADGTYTVKGIGTCTDTDIVIPAMYNGKAVTVINAKAFYECSDITSVEIPNSVTSIGNQAFSGCTGLTSVEIPNSVKSIGFSAFYNCTELTSIEIPSGVTSIGSSAFFCCTRLTNIKIPNSVTSIGSSAFRGCSSLTSITIPDGVTSIGSSAFDGCSSLTSITIPDGVTSIGSYTFDGCSGLTSITISDGVSHIGFYAFHFCRSLTSIIYVGTTAQWNDITFDSSWNGSAGHYTVTCTDGTVSKDGTVTLYSTGLAYTENEDGTYTVGGIGACTDADIVIPPTYSGKAVTAIAPYAFQYCSHLKSITISESVKSIGVYAFMYCSSVTSIVILGSETSIGNCAFAWCDSLTSFVIPESATRIGDSLFWGCDRLTSIVIPESVKSIEKEAFYGCNRLASIQFDGTAEQWYAISKGYNWNYGTGNYTVTCTDGTVTKDGSVTYH